MDRRTLLAVVFSVVIIVGGMIVQPILFPPKPGAQKTAQQAPAKAAAQQQGQQPQAQTAQSQPAQQTPQQAVPAVQQARAGKAIAGSAAATAIATGKVVETPDSAPPASQGQTIQRDTDLYGLTFATDGGTLTSVKLRKYRNIDGSPVEMLLLPKTMSSGEMPFAIAFGDYKADAVTVPFALHETSDAGKSTFDFFRSFYSPTGVPFTLHKTWIFYKDEYLFQLQVTIQNSVNDYPALNFGGYAYTLSIGPQIGPHYLKLDGRNEFRKFAYYADNKRSDPGVGMGQLKELDRVVTWAAIEGKYFTAIAVPDGSVNHIVFDSRKLVEGFDRSSISFERPVLKDVSSTDKYSFYLGPMKTEILSRYNQADSNHWGVAGLNADKVVTTSFAIIAWLSVLLKYLLDFFYLIIPNYGIAIILLTILIKVVFLPLTFKSSESTAKMAAVNPRIQEIRTRLKDKPERMNQEIAELYKREKINPLSGCLPLLLQIPVFFALYNLLNNYFELRGAMFIPGWIPDLSVPEAIVNLPFPVPLLVMTLTAIRGLPLLMVASQLLQGKFTQPTDQSQAGSQMKLMTYALPIVFLFILYDMPSGLVLYWTVQNILSIFQQLYINSLKKKKDAQAAAATPVVVKSGSKSGLKMKR